MFECDKCGLCCLGLDRSELMADLHNGDGICKNLDLDTMLCRIYEERPIFCNVEKYYDLYLTDKMDREDFMQKNYEACKLKKEEWEECGRDIRKMTSKIPEMDEKREQIILDSLEAVLKTQ